MKRKFVRYCIICGKREFRLIKVIGKYKIYECRGCEIAYTDDSKVLKRDRLKKLKSMYNFNDYKREEKKHTKKFKKIIKIARRYKKKGRVLDIGGGYGLLATLLSNNKKYKVEILEPYLIPHYAVDHKIKTHKIKLEPFLNKKSKGYDIIFLIDVLEHLNNPNQILQSLYKLLNKGGILVIELPNFKSVMAKLSNNWAWWMVEDHKYHFTSKSLIKILQKNRFKLKYLSSFETVRDFKKNLDSNFISVPIAIRKIFKVFTVIPFFVFYNILKQLLWKLGLGGLIIGVFKKKD